MQRRAEVAAHATAQRAYKHPSVKNSSWNFLAKSGLKDDDEVVEFVSSPALGVLTSDALINVGEDLAEYERWLDGVETPTGAFVIQATTRTSKKVVEREYASGPGMEDLEIIEVRMSDGRSIVRADC